MKTFFKYFRPTIIPVTLFLLLALFFWKWNMSKINKDLQNKVSTIIKKTINQQLEINPFLPDVILINADSTQNKQLTASLKKEITSFLVEYYLNKNNKQNYDNLDFEPFFVFPRKTDRKGKYLLTDEQINNLRLHINFLTKKVESEVNRTKEEVGRDIDRLNTWVTIWIGFIGLIGIFIPIILNIDVSKKVSEAVKSGEIAKKRSTKANEKAEEAKNESQAALNETKVVKSNLSLIIALNSLKEFDANVIIKIPVQNRNLFLKNILEKATKAIKDNLEYFDSPLLLNWLGQFAISIQGISISKSINRSLTIKLNDIANLIDEFLENNTKEKYQNIITELEKLLKEV